VAVRQGKYSLSYIRYLESESIPRRHWTRARLRSADRWPQSRVRAEDHDRCRLSLFFDAEALVTGASTANLATGPWWCRALQTTRAP